MSGLPGQPKTGYGLIMQRLLSLFVLILAVAALSGPSLARGLDGLGNRSAPLYVVVDDDGLKPAWFDCKTRDGKRQVPCHPDLGVLATALPQSPEPMVAPLLVSSVSPPPARFPEAELPPPR